MVILHSLILYLRTCETIPPLGSSDHMGVLTTLFFQCPNQRNPSYLHRKVWCYDLADFNMARSRPGTIIPE